MSKVKVTIRPVHADGSFPSSPGSTPQVFEIAEASDVVATNVAHVQAMHRAAWDAFTYGTALIEIELPNGERRAYKMTVTHQETA